MGIGDVIQIVKLIFQIFGKIRHRLEILPLDNHFFCLATHTHHSEQGTIAKHSTATATSSEVLATLAGFQTDLVDIDRFSQPEYFGFQLDKGFFIDFLVIIFQPDREPDILFHYVGREFFYFRNFE